jgi:hypothetical protein
MRWLGGIFKEALEQVVGEMLQRQLLWRRRGLKSARGGVFWRCGPCMAAEEEPWDEQR